MTARPGPAPRIRRWLCALAAVVSVAWAGPALAQKFYSWTDESGQPHYTDNLNSVPERYRNQMRVLAGEAPEGAASPEAAAPSETPALPSAGIEPKKPEPARTPELSEPVAAALSARRFEEAVELSSRARKEAPSDVSVALGHSSLLMRVEAELPVLAKTDPSRAYRLATLLADAGSESGDVSRLAVALALQLGTREISEGRVDKGFEQLDDADVRFGRLLAARSKLAGAWATLGRLALAKEAREIAERAARRSLERDSRAPDAYILLGTIAEQRDDHAEAVRQWQLGQRRNPENAELKRLLGRAERRH